MTLEQMLIRDEGLYLKVYTCPSGKLTIGVGRNLEDRGISHAEAMSMLRTDIAYFNGQVTSYLPWSMDLDDARYAVLVNMAFNMGIEGLLGFKNMLLAMRYRNWKKAAEELLNSKYTTQVGDRAQRLAKQLETGEWQ